MSDGAKVAGLILAAIVAIWIIGSIVNYSTCAEGHVVRQNTAKPSDYFVCDRRSP